MSQQRRIVTTAALPYANGAIHIGHLVEYLQTDFWVRFQKMRSHECLYFCADDTHGTPIMVRARQEGISPEELIARSHKEHLSDFRDFQIEFDHYSSTHSQANRETCNEIYLRVKELGHIDVRPVSQSYCEHDKMFLPDRFVKGSCPRCGAKDQYGDSCDKCGATYGPTEMSDACCTICGNRPVERTSDHVFFRLNDFREFLLPWISAHTPPEVSRKLQEWFKEDLRDWDISRDAPYFGFSIPELPDKYFYVWVDAPIGYISTTREWCEQNGKNFSEYWCSEETEIYHFIGKDIVYFHTLFWPAMLYKTRFKTPTQVFVHGFLTVNGEKMSKSKGTFISARQYLDHLDPMYLRYYYACKLSDTVDDVDLNLADFISRVNSDLIGKITNLGSRGAQMLGKRLGGQMADLDQQGRDLVRAAQDKSEIIAEHYERRQFSKVITEIRTIADEANRYFDEKQPWQMIKTNENQTRSVLTAILNIFRIITIYLKPILPKYAEQVEKLFNEPPYRWQDAQCTLINQAIGDYVHLATRVEPASVERMVESAKTVSAIPSPLPSKPLKAATTTEISPIIDIDDFMKVDLRIAKIVQAQGVAGADKLLQLTLDLGPDLGQRNVFAGIKSAYRPEDLVGRMTVMVANLQPRKMKFGVSEGMVLAAGPGGQDLFILSPDNGARPGQKVK